MDGEGGGVLVEEHREPLAEFVGVAPAEAGFDGDW